LLAFTESKVKPVIAADQETPTTFAPAS